VVRADQVREVEAMVEADRRKQEGQHFALQKQEDFRQRELEMEKEERAKKEADARAQASRGRCCYCAPISTGHVQMNNYRSWYWARSLEVQRSRHAGY
jgi:hypothetical protein